MPYAPTVNDNSGQILASGINSASQNFFQGLAAYAQRKEENKALAAQNKALEALIKPAAGAAGMPEEAVTALVSSSPDESPRARNARLTAAYHGVITQQQLQDEKQRQQLQQLQMDELRRREADDQRNEAAARAAVSPVLPDPGAVAAAMKSGAPIPQAQQPDYSDAVMRYLRSSGNNPATLSALNELARNKATVTEREGAATLRAKTAEDKLGNATGNFDSIDKAAEKVLELQKKGIRGVHIVTKPKGTYDIEVKPPTEYAPDAAGKVQALIDNAKEELAAAVDNGDTAAAAAAQQKIANFEARLKKVNYVNEGWTPGAGGSASAVDAANADATGAAPVVAAPGAPAAAAPAKMPAKAAAAAATPNAGAIRWLQLHPELAAQFDVKYGKGAAAKVLGKP